MRKQAIALFREVFGSAPTHGASAPGRVNLIGDHTDYNGGPVLPMAIFARSTVVAGPHEAGWLRVVSARDRYVERVRWEDPVPAGWVGYIVGVMRELALRGAAPSGACLALASDVPVGAGLASSAALTVSTAKALSAVAGATLSTAALVAVAHRAEYEHVGVRCGIMDQTIAVRGCAGHALLLECASGQIRHIPLQARLLLVDTGSRHDLTTSAYNERRAECDVAAAILARSVPDLKSLAEWPVARTRELQRRLPRPLWMRVMHVVTETDRTRAAAALLARKQLRGFGRLVNASHESCRRWYECSAPALDLVVRAARRAGAWGARMTGAGWGGSVLVVVGSAQGSAKREASIRRAVSRAFLRAYGREPSITAVHPGPGVRRERVV